MLKSRQTLRKVAGRLVTAILAIESSVDWDFIAEAKGSKRADSVEVKVVVPGKKPSKPNKTQEAEIVKAIASQTEKGHAFFVGGVLTTKAPKQEE